MYLDSRRNFLKYGFLSSSVVVMSGCELFSVVTPRETIELVHADIFPKAKELGINTFVYMGIVLNHSRILDEDKEFIKNGVKWLNEEAVEKYSTTYTKLTCRERQDILKIVSRVRWGDSWINEMLTFALEATFSDPVYGVNKRKSGWKWLDYQGGLPRPKEALL
ncbi:MAG: gluconate 2-dehydrogenase subunit 3 family protein [Campylobacterota bacterium]